MSNEFRLLWLRRIACLGLLCGLLFASKLWLVKSQLISKVPVYGWFDFSYPIDAALYFVLLAALLFLYSKEKYFTYGIVLFVSLLMMLGDQLRWRVAFYIYLLVIIGLAFRFLSKKQEADVHTLFALRWMFIGIYFWAGIHKLNFSFLYSVFPWMVRGLFPESVYPQLAMLGFAIPFIESLLALGLISSKTRRLSLLGLFFMHLLILLCIGPLGHNWNHFVWPWNLAMMAFVFILFWGWDGRMNLLLFQSRGIFHWIIVLLIFVAPLGNFIGYWDHYPSFHLYSGATPEASLEIEEGKPTSTNVLLSELSTHEGISMTELVMREKGMTPYPAVRYFLGIFRGVCKNVSQSYSLVITDRSSRFSKKAERLQFTCVDVLK